MIKFNFDKYKSSLPQIIGICESGYIINDLDKLIKDILVFYEKQINRLESEREGGKERVVKK